VKDVTDALVNHAGEFVRWPMTNTDRSKVKTGFYQQARFPNVIGCIDGTHVRIVAPGADENAYVNRKGFHSINVQAVCDHDGKIFSLDLRNPCIFLKNILRLLDCY
jgi:hypothetical protein